MEERCESRARERVQRRRGSSFVIIRHRPERVGTREQPTRRPPPPPTSRPYRYTTHKRAGFNAAREFLTIREAERTRSGGRRGAEREVGINN